MLVDLSAIDSFVFKQDPAFVFNCAVCKVNVDQSRDNNQQDEKCAQENLNLVLLLKQETGHRDRHVVVTGAIRVAVLQEVVTGCVVCQNLQDIRETESHLHCMP